MILPSEETQSLAETTGTETIDAREDEPQTLEVYQPETTVNSIPLKYYQALNRANAFSNTMHMSKADIYDQIISAYGDNFSADAAQYAVDHLTNVWEPEEQEPVPTAQDSAEMVSNDMLRYSMMKKTGSQKKRFRSRRFQHLSVWCGFQRQEKNIIALMIVEG